MTAYITAAARAAWTAANGFLGKPNEPTWEELHPDIRATFVALARATFAAVRVPSEAMLDAATTSQERRALFAVQWTYAVDALLSEEP